MYIEEIEIRNFRGLSLDMKDLKKRFLIIGKNDSGKSNFCYAIRKVLDYSTRKKILIESDSTDFNKEDICIRIKLDLEGISSNNRARLGEHIDVSDDVESLTVNFEAVFNEDIQAYEETISFGSIDNPTKRSALSPNVLDRVLDFIYVYPSYDLNRDTKNFFTHYKSENEKNNISIGEEVISGIKDLNSLITKDPVVDRMRVELSNLQSSTDIFGDINFGIDSNIEISNIYNSLRVRALYDTDKTIEIGDGRSKTLSLILQRLIKNTTKEKIIILEEPENHLYPLLQKQFASLVDSFSLGQTIITTHSPSIIDFRKTEEIIKFQFEKEDTTKIFQHFRTNIDEKEIYKQFGYSLNEEIAETFFYDEVLLVEGYSERLFYNVLVNNDEEFRNRTLKRSIGFLCVYGVDFKPAKDTLESIGIKVHVLTDNDFYGVNNKPDNKRYAGLQNAFSMLSESDILNLSEKINSSLTKESFNVEIGSEEHKFINDNMEKILEFFYDRRIYIHLNHDEGFEGAFLDFIKVDKDRDKIINNLKAKKMKNLHRYIIENDLVLIAAKNRDNILVKFIYDN